MDRPLARISPEMVLERHAAIHDGVADQPRTRLADGRTTANAWGRIIRALFNFESITHPGAWRQSGVSAVVTAGLVQGEATDWPANRRDHTTERWPRGRGRPSHKRRRGSAGSAGARGPALLRDRTGPGRPEWTVECKQSRVHGHFSSLRGWRLGPAAPPRRIKLSTWRSSGMGPMSRWCASCATVRFPSMERNSTNKCSSSTCLPMRTRSCRCTVPQRLGVGADGLHPSRAVDVGDPRETAAVRLTNVHDLYHERHRLTRFQVEDLMGTGVADRGRERPEAFWPFQQF
jgi:hypothetical protein